VNAGHRRRSYRHYQSVHFPRLLCIRHQRTKSAKLSAVEKVSRKAARRRMQILIQQTRNYQVRSLQLKMWCTILHPTQLMATADKLQHLVSHYTGYRNDVTDVLEGHIPARIDGAHISLQSQKTLLEHVFKGKPLRLPHPQFVCAQ